MKPTLQEAYDLAILKWQWVVNRGGGQYKEDLAEEIPELGNFPANCSYCELFYEDYCEGCPLNITPEFGGHGCLEETHPWNIWMDDLTKENAEKVLELIIKTKPV